MNETLKRSISGAVYVILLIACILFSTESFFILFGVFLLIATVEFCNLIHLNKTIPFLLAAATYILFYQITIATNGFLYQLRFNNTFDMIVLVFTLIVFLKCIHFLFDNKTDKIDSFSKYIYLIGYVILPFVNKWL
jgi:phosphatidate cytidylyltransferase